MALYDGVAAVAREVSKKYDGVSAVAREVSAACDGVNGVAREYFKSGTPIGSLAVGSTVYMKVNGISKAFIVVNQGCPSSVYDSTCNGTWLLMKDIYTTSVWNSSTAYNYATSTIHSYLNSTFLNLFDSNIKSIIKQVKLPYALGDGLEIATGANGLSTKIFLLSYIEVNSKVGTTSSRVTQEGAPLAYFSNYDKSKLIAYLNGTATMWWIRSVYYYSTGKVPSRSGMSITTLGYDETTAPTNTCGVRPALILPSTQLVDSSFNLAA